MSTVMPPHVAEAYNTWINAGCPVIRGRKYKLWPLPDFTEWPEDHVLTHGFGDHKLKDTVVDVKRVFLGVVRVGIGDDHARSASDSSDVWTF